MTRHTLELALNDSRPTLVEFFATWCPHCRRMMPIVDELRSRVGNSANIIQIDGDDNNALMGEFEVTGFPTWILFSDGQIMWRDSGEMSLATLLRHIREAT